MAFTMIKAKNQAIHQFLVQKTTGKINLVAFGVTE